MSKRHSFSLLFFLVAFLVMSPFAAFSQQHHERLAQLDVQHYAFSIMLNNENEEIKGNALIHIRFKQAVSSFYLDLTNQNDKGTGMLVNAVTLQDQAVKYEHKGDRLTIQLPKPAQIGELYSFRIDYQGTPADGLIIDQNKFGDKTFFGDNWPNRAHHWLPTVDHPSDKASVEFIVTAPEHYQVIANGIQLEETNLENGLKLTHWGETVVLPTKVMVMGAAPFAVRLAGETHGIPVTTWVFPDNRLEGFYDYEQAVSVLDWFITHVGPYPYKKLANVQSKTRYGGMENASNIFYFENSVNGKRERENLIAHEIAHQWFGNSASEANWHHAWLSEGFATYLTDLYIEHTKGRDTMVSQLESQRQQVIRFANRKLAPIVDTTITDYNQVLNTNSYQNGGWVLHMLRQEIGDEAFWKGIRTYYDRFKYNNALTDDLRRVMEEVSGKDLKAFFQQWLFVAGYPKLETSWNYNNDSKQLTLELKQTQKGAAFQFPIDVAIYYENESTPDIRSFQVKDAAAQFTAALEKKPTKIVLDPNVKLLFEGTRMKKEN
ncbi:MAG: M1 family metallopeptidase [Saprospiraceae bacterium]|nr:M1 family metallopeptidase [Saprospiraceae bacterium]